LVQQSINPAPRRESPEGSETADIREGPRSAGLILLLDRLWGFESTHKLVLAEFFRHTELARSVGLWERDARPRVVVEPDRGIFDLALATDTGITTLVELKFGAESSRDQRGRQRAWAQSTGADRAYILLGTSFFEIEREAACATSAFPRSSPRWTLCGLTALLGS
jgi:hypothetical protein